jgi:5-methylthioribose kinase
VDAFVDLLHDTAALQYMLQEMGLARAGEPVKPVPLTGGVSSNIFRVDLQRGPVCVKQALPKLKVEKEWFAPTTRVLAEIDYLTLAHTIVPAHIPRLLGADRRRGAFVMEFLAGMFNWKAELLAGHVDPAVGVQIAEVLARIHAATAHRPDLARRFANDANFFALRLDAYLVEAARQHGDLSTPLIGLVHTTQTTPLALVHGDVSPKNILLGLEGPLLLDAECAWYGDPAFDLAFLLNHMLLKAALSARDAEALHETYARIASTYLAEVSWEPAELFERRCARLLAGLLLARIDGKSPVEYLDDAARRSVRSAARGLIAEPAERLADVARRYRAALAADGCV